jgi:hypothetical protein
VILVKIFTENIFLSGEATNIRISTSALLILNDCSLRSETWLPAVVYPFKSTI